MQAETNLLLKNRMLYDKIPHEKDVLLCFIQVQEINQCV